MKRPSFGFLCGIKYLMLFCLGYSVLNFSINFTSTVFLQCTGCTDVHVSLSSIYLKIQSKLHLFALITPCLRAYKLSNNTEQKKRLPSHRPQTTTLQIQFTQGVLEKVLPHYLLFIHKGYKKEKVPYKARKPPKNP